MGDSSSVSVSENNDDSALVSTQSKSDGTYQNLSNDGKKILAE